jgi:D-threo-aldose 1-dehydrogenase
VNTPQSPPAAEFGNTGLRFPKIVFGNSYFGNLYRVIPDETLGDIAAQWFEQTTGPVVIDTAGKYGAGLALENTGRLLKGLGVDSAQVVISNKLGWKRVPLTAAEATFEPGVWAGLEHDAEQCISYEGILECWEQGCELLGEYTPSLVSVHDPDEFLDAATSSADRSDRIGRIVEAYRALHDLKSRGCVKAIGIGAKNWRVIAELYERVALDWIMFANSLTIMRHPTELVTFMERAAKKGVGIINSAVFHGGFLTGGSYFDYRPVDENNTEDAPLFEYRKRLDALCERWSIEPAAACIQFALAGPGVSSLALNTSNPDRVRKNVEAGNCRLPVDFWDDLRRKGLIAAGYSYLPGE